MYFDVLPLSDRSPSVSLAWGGPSAC